MSNRIFVIFITAAIKNFENKGFPSKKEAWKYTSLNAILKMISTIFPNTENTIEYRDVKNILHEIDSFSRMVL